MPFSPDIANLRTNHPDPRRGPGRPRADPDGCGRETVDRTRDSTHDPPPPTLTMEAPTPTLGAMARALEGSRFLVVIGAVTALALAAVTFCWAVVKAFGFAAGLVTARATEDAALVKLFESIDTLLIGTVLLIIGLGLWELFVGDLRLPPALTVSSFDDLKTKVATTLVMVLVVRFLELFVRGSESRQLLEVAVAVSLVGGLLLALAHWRRRPAS